MLEVPVILLAKVGDEATITVWTHTRARQASISAGFQVPGVNQAPSPAAVYEGLADEALEDAIYDSQSMREFTGIELSRETVPDATTLLKFRRLLEEHGLTAKLFEGINADLAERGLLLREGTMVDATIIDQERRQVARPRDAPDEEGQRVALWDEGTHRR